MEFLRRLTTIGAREPEQAAPARPTNLQYRSSMLVLSMGEGVHLEVAETKGGLLSSSTLRLQTTNAAVTVTPAPDDAHVFCLMPVSSTDTVVRDGDVVAIWAKARGGLCLQTEIAAAPTATSRFATAARSFLSKPAAAEKDAGQLTLKLAPSDEGEASWYVVTSSPHPGDFEISWFCKPCQQKNGPEHKICPRCNAPRVASVRPPLAPGAQVFLVPVVSPLHVLQVNAQGTLVAGPLASPTATSTATFELNVLMADANRGSDSAGFGASDRALVNAGLAMLNAGVFVAAQSERVLTANHPNPNHPDVVLARNVAAAAPAVAALAEKRYRDKPDQMMKDINLAVRVADKVANNPAAQALMASVVTAAMS